MNKIKAERFIVYIANLYFKLQILLLFLLLIYLSFQFFILEEKKIISRTNAIHIPDKVDTKIT